MEPVNTDKEFPAGLRVRDERNGRVGIVQERFEGRADLYDPWEVPVKWFGDRFTSAIDYSHLVKEMDLQQRWLELWERSGAQGKPYLDWPNIVDSYQSPGRFYHNLGHIQDLLEKLDLFFEEVPEQEFRRDCLEWAIFFHDLIYNIGPEVKAGFNEAASADMASLTAVYAGLGRDFWQEVKSLILATQHQGTQGLSYSQELMIQLDLSILGADPETFDEYERNVYREYVEYGGVDPELFRRGRKAILEGFLKRESIFSIRFFRERYEERAKENLARSISALS